MMDKTNISEIESFLESVLKKGKVSKHVFAGTFPSVINKGWNEMCLIDTSSVDDYDAYGQGIVLVYLYVKPNTDGTKNVMVMNEMEKALDAVIHDYPCERYYLSRRSKYVDFDPQIKWHTNIVEIKVTIV